LGILGLLQKNAIRAPFFVIFARAYHGFSDPLAERLQRELDYLEVEKSRWISARGPIEIDGKNYWSLPERQGGAIEPDAWPSINIAEQLNFVDGNEYVREMMRFFADRLKVQQREAGVRHDLIDAVFALGGEDDLVRLLARVNALQSFIASDDGTNLLTAYKRAANILKKEDWPQKPSPLQGGGLGGGAPRRKLVLEDIPLPSIPSLEAEGKIRLSYTPEKAEKALADALAKSGPKAEKAVEKEDFEGAMAALAALRGPIDTFFDEVTVNDEDSEKRAARLGLLAQFRAAVHKVADFSKIEG
jgi:glycyl-tRNA synthetase beta subunit